MNFFSRYSIEVIFLQEDNYKNGRELLVDGYHVFAGYTEKKRRCSCFNIAGKFFLNFTLGRSGGGGDGRILRVDETLGVERVFCECIYVGG